MDPTVKKIASIAASALILVIMWYSAYLPLKKGKLYVAASRELSGVKSLNDFTAKLSSALDVPSPIGQEELVRNVGSVTLTIVQANGENAELTDALMKYLDGYYAPILERGRGMSFSQNLYIMGLLNETAALKTRHSAYILAAERYFTAGRALGPERPQFLYGLFDVYRIKGDIAAARAVAADILMHWPNDTRITAALAELDKQTTSTPKTK